MNNRDKAKEAKRYFEQSEDYAKGAKRLFKEIKDPDGVRKAEEVEKISREAKEYVEKRLGE